MPVHTRGRVCFWRGGSLWIGETTVRTDPHAHHALQITLALDGRFTLLGPGGRSSGPASVVAPDTVHAFDADGVLAHIFVDPETREGRALRAATPAETPATLQHPSAASTAAKLLDGLRGRRPDEELAETARRLVADIAGAAPDAESCDPRVLAAIAWTADRLGEPVSLAQAASVACLSPSRFRHLFVEETGQPFRTWLLWSRLMKAVEIYAAGGALTEAAYGAGFSDSAHLSRTFRRMFGITAASLRVD